MVSNSEIVKQLREKLKEAGYVLPLGLESIKLALEEVHLVRATPYLLIMEGDCEPETLGPFETPEARDQKAREIRRRSDRDGVYGMDVVEPGKPDIWPYSGSFIKGGE
jgi:hypothetical protein